MYFGNIHLKQLALCALILTIAN